MPILPCPEEVNNVQLNVPCSRQVYGSWDISWVTAKQFAYRGEPLTVGSLRSQRSTELDWRSYSICNVYILYTVSKNRIPVTFSSNSNRGPVFLRHSVYWKILSTTVLQCNVKVNPPPDSGINQAYSSLTPLLNPAVWLCLCSNKKAVLSQGNRAMPQLFFSV